MSSNHEQVTAVLTQFIQEEIRKAGLQKAVLGLSGGIDSAIVCALAARALGPENVYALCLPYKSSNPESEAHAATPRPVHNGKDQSGKHRDVQARDAHQMVDAGACEHLPIRLRNTGLIAYGQSGQHTCIGCIAKRFLEMRTHLFA